jgi:hypothetical protein
MCGRHTYVSFKVVKMLIRKISSEALPFKEKPQSPPHPHPVTSLTVRYPAFMCTCRLGTQR